KWIIERIEGRAAAADTPIGRVPTADQLDLSGLTAQPGDVSAALAVDPEEWRAELPRIEQWFDKVGGALPGTLRDELDALKQRLAQR
ncbi:MAG TPA: phosphoenolpyruvate carboxykinase domain-containing protein, partial [Pseudonocardiaceae bacterium]|nr:phosphoenolpyruvate carboxykinase domain-containing protein [Pseudonocardiaceae bacterium]